MIKDAALLAQYKLIRTPQTELMAFILPENVQNLDEAFVLHHSKNLFSMLKKIGGEVYDVIKFLLEGKENKAIPILKKLGQKDIMKFVIMLDSATFFIIAHVFHTIDALTGWNTYGELKKFFNEAQDNVNNLIDMLHNIKDDIEKTFDKKTAKKIMGTASELEHQLVRNQ